MRAYHVVGHTSHGQASAPTGPSTSTSAPCAAIDPPLRAAAHPLERPAPLDRPAPGLLELPQVLSAEEAAALLRGGEVPRSGGARVSPRDGGRATTCRFAAMYNERKRDPN